MLLLQNVSDSSVYPALTLKAARPPWTTSILYWGVIFEGKMWAPSVLSTTGVLCLQALPSDRVKNHTVTNLCVCAHLQAFLPVIIFIYIKHYIYFNIQNV